MDLWQKKWGWVFYNKPKLVDKSAEVKELYFPSKDVLFTDNDKAIRGRELLFVSRPTFKNCGLKLKVLFEDIEGPKSVVFSKWTISDSDIEGDKKVKIPIHRIRRMKLLSNSQLKTSINDLTNG